MATCEAPGCDRPTWNGQPGEYCGRRCKNAAMANKPRIDKLDKDSEDFISVSDQFYKKWKPETWSDRCGPNLFPVPLIKDVYKLFLGKDRPDYYEAKSRMKDCSRMPGAGVGNELRRFHGTRLACDFNGKTCDDDTCCCCSIIKTSKFYLDKSGDSSGTATYGNGLYFTAMSHTAKGYGIDRSLQRAPRNMEDFVSKEAKNAVLLVLCLAGNAEEVEGIPYDPNVAPKGMDPPDPDEFHSRVVKKGNGNDELVIFDEAQAMPRYMITFDGPADTNDPDEFVKSQDEVCMRDGCTKRTWNGKPNEYCSKGCKKATDAADD